MLGVVSELTDQYAAHPSFRGMGVQLAADGYAQLPGSEGSYDDDTIACLHGRNANGSPRHRGDALSGPGQFLAEASARSKWLAWRAAKLSGLYQPNEPVGGRRPRPERDCIWPAVGSFDSPAVRRSLRPALPRQHAQSTEALLQLGFLPESFREDPIVLLRPHRIEPLESLTAQAVDLELSLDPEIDRL